MPTNKKEMLKALMELKELRIKEGYYPLINSMSELDLIDFYIEKFNE